MLGRRERSGGNHDGGHVEFVDDHQPGCHQQCVPNRHIAEQHNVGK